MPLGYTRDEQGTIVDPASAAGAAHVPDARAAEQLGRHRSDSERRGRTDPTRRSWYPSTVREVLMHEAAYRGGKRGESESRWPIILDSAVPRLPTDKRKRRSASKARQRDEQPAVGP